MIVFRGREQYEQQVRLSNLSMRMRQYGVRVDRDAIDRHRKQLTQALDDQRRKFEQLVPGYHIVRGKKLKTRTHVYVGPYRLGEVGSHSDLRRLFFGKFAVKPTSYTDEGQPVLDDDALLSIAQTQTLPGEVARQVLKYRELATLKSRYIDGLPIFEDGRLHPEWKSGWGTKTTRWSSKGPNLQNLPDGRKRVNGTSMRDIILADEGNWFVKTDMSSLELIIQATLAGDLELIDWYNRGLSGYLETARTAYNDPSLTKKSPKYALFKKVILALNYGAELDTIHKQIIPVTPTITLGEVRETIDRWWSTRPLLYDWREKHLVTCRKTKYVEAELSGLRQYFYGDDIEPTKALNFPMQANAAKIMNDALERVSWELDWSKEQISLMVHDEIDTQGPDPTRIKEIHQRAMEVEITLAGRTIRLKTETSYGRNLKDMVVMQ